MGDPLDELRGAWRDLPAPDPDAGDETTRAVVDWSARAWRSLPVAEAPRVPRARRRRPWRRAAAAAAIVISAGLALRFLPPSSSGGPGPGAPGPSNDTRDRAAQTPVARVRPDGVELRAGTVRLILLDGARPRSEVERRKENR